MQMDWGGEGKGGAKGEEGRRGEKRSAVEKAENGGESTFCFSARPNRKSFMTPNIEKGKLPEPLKQSGKGDRLTCVSWLAADETCRGGHTRVRFWVTGHSTGVCPPPHTAASFLQLPQTFISALLEMRGKKRNHPKKTRGKEVEWQLLENFSPRLRGRATVPPVLLTLRFSWQATTVSKALSPNLRHLDSGLNDAFKCY